MSGPTNTAALLRVLRSLIPESDIRIIHQRPWHSLTFAGAQICFNVQLSYIPSAQEAARISSILSKYEFTLPGLIVADITASAAEPGGGVIIDVLLLDD
jgi:hypothetical protein